MSYHKIYDSLLIKIKEPMSKKNYFLPLTLSGPSNCYEANNTRVRDWHGFAFNYDREGKRNPYQPLWEGTDEAKHEMLIDARRHYDRHWINGKSNSGEVLTFDDYLRSFGYYASIAVKGSTMTTNSNKYTNLFSPRKFREAVSLTELLFLGFTLKLVRDSKFEPELNYTITTNDNEETLYRFQISRDMQVFLQVIDYQKYSWNRLFNMQRQLTADIRKTRQDIKAILKD